eukprot:CAMPEP_0174840410 /NCGR_PEP_ID=MMETSP1114-20130205/8664_1 /TAXON_ID=312471 /ORGANISM="Neobodo designis, Strain CCAP 1951/1" /LENGTH=299 /DNA_ID=CAMNT_0016074557 /DNA_START=84 /DNA_END=979 /DNA_ORIENTATION=+
MMALAEWFQASAAPDASLHAALKVPNTGDRSAHVAAGDGLDETAAALVAAVMNTVAACERPACAQSVPAAGECPHHAQLVKLVTLLLCEARGAARPLAPADAHDNHTTTTTDGVNANRPRPDSIVAPPCPDLQVNSPRSVPGSPRRVLAVGSVARWRVRQNRVAGSALVPQLPSLSASTLRPLRRARSTTAARRNGERGERDPLSGSNFDTERRLADTSDATGSQNYPGVMAETASELLPPAVHDAATLSRFAAALDALAAISLDRDSNLAASAAAAAADLAVSCPGSLAVSVEAAAAR